MFFSSFILISGLGVFSEFSVVSSTCGSRTYFCRKPQKDSVLIVVKKLFGEISIPSLFSELSADGFKLVNNRIILIRCLES